MSYHLSQQIVMTPSTSWAVTSRDMVWAQLTCVWTDAPLGTRVRTAALGLARVCEGRQALQQWAEETCDSEILIKYAQCFSWTLWFPYCGKFCDVVVRPSHLRVVKALKDLAHAIAWRSYSYGEGMTKWTLSQEILARSEWVCRLSIQDRQSPITF